MSAVEDADRCFRINRAAVSRHNKRLVADVASFSVFLCNYVFSGMTDETDAAVNAPKEDAFFINVRDGDDLW